MSKQAGLVTDDCECKGNDFSAVPNWTMILARDSICSARYMLSPICLSVYLSLTRVD